MSETMAREIEAMAARRMTPEERMRALIANLTEQRVLKAYRRLFVTGGGTVDDGALVLADLAKAAGLGKVKPDAGGELLTFREGKRGMLLHVFARLDRKALEQASRRITQLQTNKREQDDNG